MPETASKSVAMVVSDFNDEITGRMQAMAESEAKAAGVHIAKVLHVPGVLDMPLVCAMLLERDDVDGVVALGCVLKGETGHDELVAHTCARQLSDLSIEFAKPVAFGVIGPGATHTQATARSDDYAKRAVRAAAVLIDVLQEIEG